MEWLKKPKGRSRVRWCSEPLGLDIETSHNHDPEHPICWMCSCQLYFDGVYTFLRTPMEVVEYLKNLIETYNLGEEKKLLVIIHNASFDLSYLLPYFQKYLPGAEDAQIIADAPHKIKMYSQAGLEFRCTYQLTHKSLATWTGEMGVEHQKKVGLYDYDEVIYQDSKLSENQKEYDKNDVVGLVEAFKVHNDLRGDTTATVPLTQTGYVRRTGRRLCNKDRYYRQHYVINARLYEESYNGIVCSYAGGYTHNNRHYQGRIIRGSIGHRDFRSHYPTQARVNMLPVGRPQVYYDSRWLGYRIRHVKTPTIDDILGLYPEYSTVTRLKLYKAQIKSEAISMPFLQYSKLLNCEEERCLLDNGRVLSFKGKATLYVDNHTLKILKEQYHLSFAIEHVDKYKNGPLAAPLVELIDKFFAGKSDAKDHLKKVEKEYGEMSMEASIARALLAIEKEGVNAIYGMLATNPLRDEYAYSWETGFREVPQTKSVAEQLDDYYGKYSTFLAYQTGCFITALARAELYEYIKVIGYDKVLYCDTDSIFYLKDAATEAAIEALNEKKHAQAEKLNAYIINKKGKKVFYDVFEAEADCIAFKGLHAKCYGLVFEEKGKPVFKATIAGVPERYLVGMDGEKPIYITREEELAGLTREDILKGKKDFDAFKALDSIKVGFKFKECTGTTCRYLDDVPHIEYVDGHRIETAGGAIISKLEEKEIRESWIDEFEKVFTEEELNATI